MLLTIARTREIILFIRGVAEKRFGPMKLQEGAFSHVGRDYEKLSTGGYRIGHQTYLKAPDAGTHRGTLVRQAGGVQNGLDEVPKRQGSVAVRRAGAPGVHGASGCVGDVGGGVHLE